MTYVITRSCCNDASCVPVCPVNCIHPTPQEPGYRTAEMLYIDPDVCIECGACMDACPVSAIAPDYELPDTLARYTTINADYYQIDGNADYAHVANSERSRVLEPALDRPVRIAVVGSGPSGCYAATDLLDTSGLTVEVDMFERLAVPFGLVRFGVAPDHGDTKVVSDRLSALFRRKGFRIFFNVAVGGPDADVTHEDLLQHYDAVVYAVGAMHDRRLGIPGEDLPGSVAASDFVAWYNGHPDFTDLAVDLATRRAVVVGNGNVALDIARLLTVNPDVVGRTDIADHALAAFNQSAIEEVVVLGRRGPLEAAFTAPELLGLLAARGVAVRVEGADPSAYDSADFARSLKLQVMQEAAESTGQRTVVLRFMSSPVELVGTDRVTGIRVERNDPIDVDGQIRFRPSGEVDELECGLVLRSIGFKGRPVAGLPFDDVLGVVPNAAGRVLDGDGPATRSYVTGWIKRGPTGVIGTNKLCAGETVQTMLDDIVSGRLVLPDDLRSTAELEDRLPDRLDAIAWRQIDRAERAAGRPQGRPRIKLVDRNELIRVGRGDG